MSFRHEAVFYEDRDDFHEQLVPFVTEGLVQDEPMLLALDQDKLDALSGVADLTGDLVELVDMRVLGRNPARIIPAWREFADRHEGRPIRGLGEPIWADRPEPELAECHHHECLLNVAFEDRDEFQLLCPYDVAVLPESTLERARHTHDGHDHRLTAEQFLRTPLAEAPSDSQAAEFSREELYVVRMLAQATAERAGFANSRVADAVLVANELATNSIVYGGGRGSARTWVDQGAVVIELSDRGYITEVLAGRLKPDVSQIGGRGLWVVNQLCELVEIRTEPGATAVRAHLSPSSG